MRMTCHAAGNAFADSAGGYTGLCPKARVPGWVRSGCEHTVRPHSGYPPRTNHIWEAYTICCCYAAMQRARGASTGLGGSRRRLDSFRTAGARPVETTGTTRFDSYILGTFRFYWFDPSTMCIMGSDSSTVCIHVAPEHAWQQPNRMRGVGKLSP